jgi:DNA-entry nuclease
LYRVTPYFKGDELLARGVEMEAYSIEDKGGLSYHVFVYNIQPGITLDYATGKNWLSK